MDFDVALRLFMDAFRPPGEGQKIDRIMQASTWCCARVTCMRVVFACSLAAQVHSLQASPHDRRCVHLAAAMVSLQNREALRELSQAQAYSLLCYINLPPTPPLTQRTNSSAHVYISFTVLQVFGKRYHQQMPSERSGLKSADAAYVLAFSVIMLNTDLHNSQVGSCSPCAVPCGPAKVRSHVGGQVRESDFQEGRPWGLRRSREKGGAAAGTIASCSTGR
jgi:hypothetical protein